MESFAFRTLKEFENGKMSRRQLVQTLAVAAAVYGAGEQAANAAGEGSFKTIAVNHISYSCPDYTIARDFYSTLMGMDNLPERDTGTQAYLAFGPRDGGSWLLPRGFEGTTPNPVASAAAGQRGANANAAGARGGGRGTPPANAPQDPPVTAVIDHLAFTVENFDKEKTLAILKDWGLKHQGPDNGPRPDGDSYHVWDPFGYDLQICGNGMSAYSND